MECNFVETFQLNRMPNFQSSWYVSTAVRLHIVLTRSCCFSQPCCIKRPCCLTSVNFVIASLYTVVGVEGKLCSSINDLITSVLCS